MSLTARPQAPAGAVRSARVVLAGAVRLVRIPLTAAQRPGWAGPRIGRLTPTGTFSQLALPGQGSAPDGITVGPGRTIWVAETGADAIARITLPPGPAGG